MKKILHLLLALTLCCMFMALPVLAEDAAPSSEPTLEAPAADGAGESGELVTDVSQLVPVYIDEAEEDPVSYTHLDVYKRQVQNRGSNRIK